MTKKLANIASALLHPLLMPFLVFALLIWMDPLVINPINKDQKLFILATVFLSTFLIPFLSLVIFKSTRIISGFRMGNRSERVIPFSFITAFYILTSYFFFEKVDISPVFIVTITGITAVVLSVTVFSFFWKISAHSSAISFIIGFIIALNIQSPGSQAVFFLIAIIIMTGALMSARLYLNAHSPTQVFAGCGLGTCIGFVTIYFFV